MATKPTPPTLEEITAILPSYPEWPDLLDPPAAAEKLGLEVGTLAVDRARKRRIPFIKVGGSVRYSKAMLAAYLLANLRGA